MALRRKITKTAFDALSEDLKKEYKINTKNDQEYFLDVDDASELTRAHDREKARADGLAEELNKAGEKVASLTTELKAANTRSPDVAELEKSWTAKLEKSETKSAATVAKLQGAIKTTLVDGTALTLATKISNSPELMSRAIKDRLAVEYDGETPILRILDKNGKPSAGTLAELETELLTDKAYSAIVIASKASGGSAPGKTPLQRPGSAMADGTQPPVPLSALKPKDLGVSLTAAVEARRAARQG